MTHPNGDYPYDVYPYDDDVLDDLARRLYAAIPAMYRVPDGPPAGRGELRALLDVLAVPLAVLRQSIHELHADLFVDTAADRMIPYLAEMVGTRLVFPDAESNRRDVRGTVGWQRRKGTPAALAEMGGELTDRSVALQEGWKRIQLAQDLALPRLERVVPDLRPAVVAERGTGPLDALFHAVDVRRISVTTGRHHPRHVTHWLHPTITFPLREATAVDRTPPGPPGDSDVRFAMDPVGRTRPLRARRIAGDREPFVDRIPEQHFAAAPQRWFGAPGGFTVRVCGLPAATAGPDEAERVAAERVAAPQLGRGDVVLTALDQPSRGWRGAVRVQLGLATITGAGTGSWRPNPATFAERASIDLDAAGVVGAVTTGGGGPGGTRVPLLQLSPVDAVPGRFFPGVTLEIASAARGSTAAVADSALERAGFLQGVLHVRIPALEVRAEHLLHIAADGSVYAAADAAGGLLDMPEVTGDLRLAPTALLTAGPGPAWPPAPPSSEPRMLARVPSALHRGPAVLHGALPLRRTTTGFADIAAAAQCALAFAVQIERPGGPAFRPFQRLTWTGADPGGGTWTALDAAGREAPDVVAEFRAVAALRAADPDAVALAVRFECSQAGATLCPAEVAWSTDDGHTVLIHLPQLDAEPVVARPAWPAAPPPVAVSEAVRVADDGSTWASESTAVRRVALGAVAPIAGVAGLRRRRAGWRRLCAWDREDRTLVPPRTLAPTRPGRLDIDVTHGLFAFAAAEPPQRWPARSPALPAVPPHVTTDYEEGATMHLGARPAAREPVLDVRLPRPTRLVSRSGARHPDAPTELRTVPLHGSLTDALAAVAAGWAENRGPRHEVVQFEDSSSYPAETPVWPEPPGPGFALTLQAAERERPTVLVDPGPGWTAAAQPAPYAELTLCGIALGGSAPGGADWTGMALPPAEQVALRLCSVLEPQIRLEFADMATGTRVHVSRCETGGLALAGAGVLAIVDSIVDAGAGVALRAAAGEVELDRVSVGGTTLVRVLEASEVIFGGLVTVADRFRGCVRYSATPRGSTLPRVHRVVVGAPVQVVSRSRRDPAWWRLRADSDPAISRGAGTGSEMGAFGLLRMSERMAGFEQRLTEFTPAGLVSGIVRID